MCGNSIYRLQTFFVLMHGQPHAFTDLMESREEENINVLSNLFFIIGYTCTTLKHLLIVNLHHTCIHLCTVSMNLSQIYIIYGCVYTNVCTYVCIYVSVFFGVLIFFYHSTLSELKYINLKKIISLKRRKVLYIMFQGEQHILFGDPARMARVQVYFQKRKMITEDSGENFFENRARRAREAKLRSLKFILYGPSREPLNEQSMMRSDLYFRKVTCHRKRMSRGDGDEISLQVVAVTE